MDRTKGLAAGAAMVVTMLLVGVSSAAGAGHFTSCGNRPNRLEWNLEARGATCKVARQISYHGVSGKTKKVRAHLYRYVTPTGWRCLYTVFHSNKAQDSEGEIFDCRMAAAVVRWSDGPEIKPHSLR